MTVHLTQNLRAGLPKEEHRYAPIAARLLPAKHDPNVTYCETTDGRQAAVTSLEGTIQKPFILPGEVLPTLKAGCTAVLPADGTVTTFRRSGTRAAIATQVAPADHYPPLAAIMPDADDLTESRIELTLDAAILLKLAKALTCTPGNEPKVTLLIDRSLPKQNKPIPVIGEDGIGVVMGCANDGERTQAYQGQWQQYTDAAAVFPNGK